MNPDAFRHRGEKQVWKCQSSARRACSKITGGIWEGGTEMALRGSVYSSSWHSCHTNNGP